MNTEDVSRTEGVSHTEGVSRTQQRQCVKCKNNCTKQEMHNFEWIDPQCKICYNAHKKENYHKRNKIITCLLCDAKIKSNCTREHIRTKKHLRNLENLTREKIDEFHQFFNESPENLDNYFYF